MTLRQVWGTQQTWKQWKEIWVKWHSLWCLLFLFIFFITARLSLTDDDWCRVHFNFIEYVYFSWEIQLAFAKTSTVDGGRGTQAVVHYVTGLGKTRKGGLEKKVIQGCQSLVTDCEPQFSIDLRSHAGSSFIVKVGGFLQTLHLPHSKSGAGQDG